MRDINVVYDKIFEVNSGAGFNIPLIFCSYKGLTHIPLKDGDVFKYDYEGITFFNLDGVEVFYDIEKINLNSRFLFINSNLRGTDYPKRTFLFLDVTKRHKREESIGALLDS